MTTPALVFSGLCAVLGTVVYLASGNEGFAMILLGMGGAGGVGAGAAAKRAETRERSRADAEQKRGDYWQEQTQSMQRK